MLKFLIEQQCICSYENYAMFSSCYAVANRSVVSDSATTWTVPHQASLSMGLLQARILEWVALPFSKGSSEPRNRTQVSHTAGRGKPKNTGVGSLSLLQGIFPTQESNWGLLHCSQALYQLSYPGEPCFLAGYTQINVCILF